MQTTMSGPDYEITLERDDIDVTPALEPDPDWVWRDAKGNEHRWQFDAEGKASLPTLKWVEEEPVWDEDDNDFYTPGHRESIYTGEEVKPGLRVPRQRQWTYGLSRYTGWFDKPGNHVEGSKAWQNIPLSEHVPAAEGIIVTIIAARWDGFTNVTRLEFVGRPKD